MLVKLFAYSLTLFAAFSILFISVLRTASVKYELTTPLPIQDISSSEDDIDINYYLPYSGRIHPDSLLWSLKVLRDRVWLGVITEPTRKIELKLLFADKRLGSSEILFRKGKIEEGLSTLVKAEKYLEDASISEELIRREGVDTTDLLFRLSNSSLKHYQVMEKIIEIVPEDIKPLVEEIQEFPKKSFERGRNGLLEKGKTPPENPFDWQ